MTEREAFPITNEEFKEKLVLMTRFDDPAFMVMNKKHTLMITSKEDLRLLVFCTSDNQEVFVPCRINIIGGGIDILDKEDKLFARQIPEYIESKKIDRALGHVLSRIA